MNPIETIVNRLSNEWILRHSFQYARPEPEYPGLVVSVWPMPGDPAPDPFYPPSPGARVVWLVMGQRVGYPGDYKPLDKDEYEAEHARGVALCSEFRAGRYLPMLWTLEAIPPHLL